MFASETQMALMASNWRAGLKHTHFNRENFSCSGILNVDGELVFALSWTGKSSGFVSRFRLFSLELSLFNIVIPNSYNKVEETKYFG